MSLTSISFLFVFLPLALAIYYISPRIVREYVLLVISLYFYALGSAKYLLMFAIAVCITVIIGRCLYGSKNQIIKKILMISGIVMNVGILGFYKYSDFLIENWNSISGSDVELRNYALPLGISYFTFKAISYLVDIYKGKIELTDKVVRDALYLSFFGQIQSGPLSRYSESTPVHKVRFNGPLFNEGAYRFIVGFCKKVLVSNMLSGIYIEVYSTPFEEFSTLFAWLGAFCFCLQLLFDFEGYSDMAIGISAMFGYKCMENFNYPYMSQSVGEYWRRWHISLGAWFKDYLYIPLGGSKGKYSWQVYFNLLMVWLFTGIWHGTKGNYFLWAIGMFIGVSLEKKFNLPGRFKSKAVKFIYRILSMLYVFSAITGFGCDGLINGLRFIKRMYIYCSNDVVNKRAIFLMKDNWFFLLAALFLCFPIVSFVEQKISDKKRLAAIFDGCKIIIVAGLFVWAISMIVAGQNNPFAYANF